jgi:hypothetical protein
MLAAPACATPNNPPAAPASHAEPHAAPVPHAATAPQSPNATSLADVERVLNAHGHACSLENPTTLVCDGKDPEKPTLVIAAISRGTVTRLAFAISFPWKASTACAQNVTRLNELNRSNDLLKVFCTEDVLTWMAPLVIPRGRVTDEDIADFATWFTAGVQISLNDGLLVPLLK